MKFKPKSETEIAEDGLLPNGEYDAEVFDAMDKISKSSGNEMVELQLTVYDEEGRPRKIRDWLLEAYARKLRNACAALGIMDRYDAGDITAHDFVGKMCRVKIGRSKPTDDFPIPNNTVVDYLVQTSPKSRPPSKPVRQRQPAPVGADDLDDEIPF